jgi:hypothetical protein
MKVIPIIKVTPQDDFSLILEYKDGVVGRYDCFWSPA